MASKRPPPGAIFWLMASTTILMSTAWGWRRTASAAATSKAAVVITGEQRKYSPPSGSYPQAGAGASVLALGTINGSFGAFELAARWSHDQSERRFHRPASHPRGGAMPSAAASRRSTSVGLNWYPNANIRFMFDYLHGTSYKKFSTAAGGGISGTPLGTPGGRRVRCRRPAYSGHVLNQRAEGGRSECGASRRLRKRWRSSGRLSPDCKAVKRCCRCATRRWLPGPVCNFARAVWPAIQ